MKNVIFTISILLTAAVLAEPKVTNVEMVQNPRSRLVTITYDLADENGIVTVDIQTNGTSIGAANCKGFYGAVNRRVSLDEEHKIYWNPDKFWPGHKAADVTAVVTAWATNAPPTFMVVDLVNTGRVETVMYYRDEAQLPFPVQDNRFKTDYLLLKKVDAAGRSFYMGSPADELGHNSNSSKEQQHKVTFKYDYYLGIYELTQRQLLHIWHQNPSTYSTDGDMRPAETIAWYTIRGLFSTWTGNEANRVADRASPEVDRAQGYVLDRLRKISGSNHVLFDLPTEAQWEYACRAGTTTSLNCGSNITSTTRCDYLASIARYAYNSGYNSGQSDNLIPDATPSNGYSTNLATAVVGSYLPNAWGFYDMHGNVYELCLDGWDKTTDFGAEEQIEPIAFAGDGSNRIQRGGTCLLNASYNRSAFRTTIGINGSSRHTGCRLCVPLDF